MGNKKEIQKKAEDKKEIKPLHEDMSTHTHDPKAVDKLLKEQEALRKQ